MIKVSTPTLQMSAGGPTTSPFSISGAEMRRREKCTANFVFATYIGCIYSIGYDMMACVAFCSFSWVGLSNIALGDYSVL